MRLALSQIRLDGGTQLREKLVPTLIEEYRPHYREAVVLLPPPIVFCDEAGDHWLADGFHRCHAASQVLGPEGEIDCDVRAGSQRDAQLYAASANEGHGLRRSPADRRRAAALLLRDEEWRKWSDREIARRILVDPHLVGEVRAQLIATGEVPQLEERKGGDGKTRRLPAKRSKPDEADAAQAVPGVPGHLQREEDGGDVRPQLRGADAQAPQAGPPQGNPPAEPAAPPTQGGGGSAGKGADGVSGGEADRGEPVGSGSVAAGAGPLRKEIADRAEAPVGLIDAEMLVQGKPLAYDPPAAAQTVIDAERDGYRRGREEGEVAKAGALNKAAQNGYKQGQDELLSVVAGWLNLPAGGAPEELRSEVEQAISLLQGGSCGRCEMREAELQLLLGLPPTAPWQNLVNRIRAHQISAKAVMPSAKPTTACPARTDEPIAPAEIDLDLALGCALRVDSDWWAPLRKTGANDAKLREHIARLFGISVSNFGPDQVGTLAKGERVPKAPIIYFSRSERINEKTSLSLHGPALIAAARRLLQIPEPATVTSDQPPCTGCGQPLVPNRMCPQHPLSVCSATDPLTEAARKLGAKHGRERLRPWASKGEELRKLTTTLGAESKTAEEQAALHAVYLDAFKGKTKKR